MSLTFVITGVLSKPRDEIKRLIEARGHKVSSSVTRKTDYLLTGQDAGSKLDKALELDIKVIPEEALFGVLAPPAKPAPRVIYHFYTVEHGENEAMFDEEFNILSAWHCNDASWFPEYFNPWMKTLGIEVRELPANRENDALDALCDHMGYGDDFGD